MSKKITSFKPSILSLIKKGKEIYEEYGDTIISVADSIGLKDKLFKSDSVSDVSDIAQDADLIQVESEGLFAVNEPNDVAVEAIPANIKSIRKEIEEDDSFDASLSELEDAASIALDGRITNPAEVQHALATLSSVAQDTIRYAEEQETKREEIRAMRDAAIARVNAMRDVVQSYLEKSFDERSMLFAKQFECVDAALKTGNNDMLASALNSINTLAASSPFKNLADVNIVQKSLTSSETEWDI